MASNRLAKGLTPLKWVTTPAIGQGRSSGGSTAAELFESGSSQRRRPHIETLVREICQNSIDQRVGNKKAKVFFDLILLTGKKREVVGDRVNLRVGPGTKFEKVTYVNPNDSDQELVARLESGMRVLEQCISGDWARVMVDRPARYKESHQGWVAREYLR